MHDIELIPVSIKRAVGDSHNFGRFVEFLQGRYLKPRPLIWEYYVLDPRSEFRKLLDATGEFEFLPKLTIDKEPGFFHKGSAQAFHGQPLTEMSAEVFSQAAESLGRMIALCVYLGIGDLHGENIIFNIDLKNKIELAMIDIETIFMENARFRPRL